MFKSVISIFVLVAPALSTVIDGYEFCEGPYALCSTSYCTSIPGNSSYVKCACEGPFDGLNVGNTSCKARTERLISAFSILEQFTTPIQPPLYNFVCNGTNAGPWADCLDASCSTETGAIVCTCPLNKGANYYLGETCPTTAAETKKLCAQLRSTGSTSAGMTSLGTLMGGFYGNPPSVSACKSATTTGA